MKITKIYCDRCNAEMKDDLRVKIADYATDVEVTANLCVDCRKSLAAWMVYDIDSDKGINIKEAVNEYRKRASR